MKNFIVGVDFSVHSDEVLKRAFELVGAHHGEFVLHLVHVLEPIPAFSTYGFSPDELPMAGMYQSQARTSAQARLANLAQDYIAQGYEIKTALLDGNAVDGLLDYAGAQQADMLIIGTHGHGFLASFILGSVAEGVVRKALIPTLVIPRSS